MEPLIFAWALMGLGLASTGAAALAAWRGAR